MRYYSSKFLVRSFGFFLFLFATFVVAAAENEILLNIGGEVPHPLQLTMADLEKLTVTSVVVRDDAENASGYRCIPLRTLLEASGG